MFLIEDVGYEVVWDNNIGLTEEGAVATATVTFIGNYTGSVKKQFRIAENTASAARAAAAISAAAKANANPAAACMARRSGSKRQ